MGDPGMRYTLLTDGSSDRLLVHVIDWLLSQHCRVPFNGQWANPSIFPHASPDLELRLELALRYYPCDLLFVHRDAEGGTRERRAAEIRQAFRHLMNPPPLVCIIPVRMTEAWLLFDKNAIRGASGNPNGRAPLDIPAPRRLETLPDPKQLLFDLLATASETRGRKLKQFQKGMFRARQRVAESIEDFTPLRSLPAFRTFENELCQHLSSGRW